MPRLSLLCICLLLTPVGAGAGTPTRPVRPPGRYLVLVDAGKDDEFLPAAKAMARLHDAAWERFDAARLSELLPKLRKAPPRFVVFVLPPETIDVDLTHAILELATQVNEDPFVDFEYGFITGRDGAAAVRFVDRIATAWQREYGSKAALFGSWEGPQVPTDTNLSALKALGLTARDRYVRTADSEEEQQKTARAALAGMKGHDALLFFSHGYPDEMAHCFRARDLRTWKVELGPAILFNCACYNGAPGRWYAPGPGGVVDRGVVARDDAVALAVLETGVAGYFAGVDPWHGPLAMQVFYHVVDDGMRLGEAANQMFNRLALDFLPGRVHFEATIKTPNRFAGEGVSNRRHNGAGMILYGDPALAPFRKSARHLASAEMRSDPVHVKLVVRPLLDGPPGDDNMLAHSRLTDYYSVKTQQYAKELSLEVYRVVPLPDGVPSPKILRVISARSQDKDVATGEPQCVVQATAQGRLLHVRVPLQVRAVDYQRVLAIARKGITVELEP